MYCRNCGRELAAGSTLCTKCGVTPPKGNKFCQNCGSTTDPLAEVCVRCGARLAAQAPPPPGRSKLPAVLLAVFLSFWAWLYTYRRNARKFWIGLTAHVVWIGLIVWSVARVVVWTGPPNHSELPSEVIVFLIATYGGGAVVGFGVWLWALLDNVLKPDEWYRSY